MTFAALAEHCKETRYCEAFYDEQGRKLYGVRGSPEDLENFYYIDRTFHSNPGG